MPKYKLNREKLDLLHRLLLDLQDDLATSNVDRKDWQDNTITVIDYVVDQMNRVAGHTIEETKVWTHTRKPGESAPQWNGK